MTKPMNRNATLRMTTNTIQSRSIINFSIIALTALTSLNCSLSVNADVLQQATSVNQIKGLSLRKGITYKQARPLILKAGWKPNLNGKKNLDDRKVRSIFDSGNREIQDCSGTGRGHCLYTFTNTQGQVLAVSTAVSGNGDTLWGWRIERNEDSRSQGIPSGKIANGYYSVGPSDERLDVKGNQYRYDAETGPGPWQPIASLKAIKYGVLVDKRNIYWCLSSLKSPKGVSPKGVRQCSKDGWVKSGLR